MTISIKLSDKILNISHRDGDGSGCAIVLHNTFPNIHTIYSTFAEVNGYLEKLDFTKFDKLILTDIHPDDPKLMENEKILLLDHHDTAQAFHDPDKLRFVNNKVSASVLTKRFCERYFKIDLSKLNDIVYLLNDYDLWIHKNPKSRMINELFFKYWEHKFFTRFYHGDTRFTPDEIKFLREKIEDFKKVFSSLTVFEMPQIKGCLISTEKFLNDCCHSLLESGYKIVFNVNPRTKHVSIRHNIEDFHCGNFCQKMGLGGGHAFAAAFTEDNMATLQKRIDWFVEEFISSRIKL